MKSCFHSELTAVALLAKKLPLNNGLRQNIQSMDGRRCLPNRRRSWVVLNNCERGEDRITAYNTALDPDELTPTQREILLSQLQIIKLSHNEIKALETLCNSHTYFLFDCTWHEKAFGVF